MSLAQNHDGDNTLCKLDTRLSISPETLLTTVEVQDSSKPSFFTKPAEKLAHLDGLRGIAALWVWFIHFVPYISKSLLPVSLHFCYRSLTLLWFQSCLYALYFCALKHG